MLEQSTFNEGKAKPVSTLMNTDRKGAEDSLSTRGELKAGEEFQVNTVTANGQDFPSVTGLTNGGFVVTWASSGQDGSGYGVYGQRYNSVGTAVGSEFRVNAVTANGQNYPSVTDLTNGGFVVAWESILQDGSGYGVYSQRYDSAAAAAGSEFRVNTVTTDDQRYPSVTGLTNGGFVVAWESILQDGSGYGVYSQRYDSAGAAVGSEFRVNTVTQFSEEEPSVMGLTSGGFVVAWTSSNGIGDGQDGSRHGVYGQRYDSVGVAAGSEFRVNTVTASRQFDPSVMGLTDGGFVVAWESDQDGSGTGVYSQRYNSVGTAVGIEFRVNTVTTNGQFNPSVTSLTDGGFVVTWDSFGQDGDLNGVYGQRYDSAGVAVSSEFRVNTVTADEQAVSSVTGLIDGGFVVTWMSKNQDGSEWGVYGKAFLEDKTTGSPTTPTTGGGATTTDDSTTKDNSKTSDIIDNLTGSVWPFLAGGVLLLAVIGFVIHRRAKRQHAQEEETDAYVSPSSHNEPETRRGTVNREETDVESIEMTEKEDASASFPEEQYRHSRRY